MKSSLLFIFILLEITYTQNITLIIPSIINTSSNVAQNINVMINGSLSSEFKYKTTCSCSMSSLYIFNQSNAQSNPVYFLSITNLSSQVNVSIQSDSSEFSGIIQPNTCQSSCLLDVKNNCPTDKKYSINRFTIKIDGLPDINYMINCNPSIPYKPFQWGLLLILLLSIFIVTISSIYNRAASFNGFYIKITYPIILTLNVIILACGIIIYLKIPVFRLILNVVGSIIGTIGLYITLNQFFFLFNLKINNKQLCKKLRIVDVISLFISLLMLLIYWATGKSWIISLIMSFSLIIASIKIFRIDSLKMGTIFLLSVILLETIGGLIIHYGFKVSYNNFVINQFNSPLFLQLPSITPQLLRKCAWLPVLSVIQPGLVISYLRRFDLSRSTWVYLFMGYISQFFGSIGWMLIDTVTKHTVPLGLISQPLMLIFVLVFAYKRNQNRTLWTGHFHDPDIYALQTALVGNQKSQSINMAQLVDGLQIGSDQ